MRIRSSWKTATATGFLGVFLLGACSASNSPAVAPAPPSVPPLSSSPSATVVTTTATPPAASITTANPAPTDSATTTSPPPTTPKGCAPAGTGVPAGATTKQIIDVDGDGHSDTGWISDTNTFGITTASGATFSRSIDSASGARRSFLMADVDGHGTIAALATDQKEAALWLVHGCQLVPARNAEGNPYYFDLGVVGTGTGVGCSQVASTQTRSLVGLKLIRDGAGNPQAVERTQVVIDGTQARNGARDTVPANGTQGSAAAASAGQISCGNLTMSDDGVGGGR